MGLTVITTHFYSNLSWGNFTHEEQVKVIMNVSKLYEEFLKLLRINDFNKVNFEPTKKTDYSV